MDYYVWENIRGQPQVLSKTEDIAELKEMLQITVYNSTYDKQSCKSFLKRLNTCYVANGGEFCYSQNCSVVLLL